MFGFSAFSQAPFSALPGKRYSDSVSESGSALDSSDASVAYGVIETVTAADTLSMSYIVKGYMGEYSSTVPIFDEIVYGVGGNGTLVYNANDQGQRFIASVSGQLGIVRVAASVLSWGGAASAVGSVELWQLNTASATSGTLQTLLASLPLDLTKLPPTSASLASFDFSSISAAQLVAGVGYAIVFRSGSDWAVGKKAVNLLYSNHVGAAYTGIVFPSGVSNPPFSLSVSLPNATTDTPAAPWTYNDSVTETGIADTTQDRKITFLGLVQNEDFAIAVNRTAGDVSSSLTNVTKNQSGYQTFIAPKTGQLGIVSFLGSSFPSNLANPTTLGAVELWQLASNSISSTPQTLLASVPFDLSTAPTSQAWTPFDFSTVSGATLTAGVGYAIVLNAGSDWGGTTNKSWAGRALYAGFGQPFEQTFNTLSQKYKLACGVYGTWTTNTSDTLYQMSAAYAAASDTFSPSYDVSVTETGTANSTQNNTRTAYSWSENFINQAPALNTLLCNGGGGYTGLAIGQRFLSTFSGTLGAVVFNGYRYGAGTSVTTDGAIELWQLSSNDPATGVPQTLLASIPNKITDWPTSGKFAADFSNISGATLVAGTAYAIVCRAGSDWSSSTLTTTIFQVSNYSAYSLVAGITNQYRGSVYNGSGWFTISDFCTAIYPAGAGALDSVDGIDYPPNYVFQTETGTANSTQDRTYNHRNYLAEHTTETPYVDTLRFLPLGMGQGVRGGAFDTLWYGFGFIANKTSGLASITISASGATQQTTDGTIELWQLASNTANALPQTLLGSTTWKATSITATSPGTNYQFDLSGLNATLTSGTGYAVLFRANAGWTSYTTLWGADPNSYPRIDGSGVWSITRVSGTDGLGTGTTFTVSNGLIPIVRISDVYGSALDAQTVGAQTYNDSITETGTADSTQDRKITAMGVLSDNVAMLTNLYDVRTFSGGSVGPTNSVAQTFIAPQSGQLGGVLAFFNAGTNTTGSDGSVELWQLSSNNISASLSVKLASIPLPCVFTQINYWREFDFSGVPGATLTAGVGYAIVFKAASDWSATVSINGYGAGVFDLNQPSFDQFPNIISGLYVYRSGTYGTWSSTYSGRYLAVGAFYAKAVDTETYPTGATYSDSLTESGTAGESELVSLIANTQITEAGSSNHTQTNTVDFTSDITEAGSGNDQQAGANNVNRDITESGTGSDQQTGSWTTSSSATETGNGQDSQSNYFAATTAITEAGSSGHTQSDTVDFTSAITEAGASAVANDAAAQLNGSGSESGSAGDTSTNGGVIGVSSTETGAAIEAPTASAAFISALTEAGSGSDSLSALATLNGVNTETGSAADQLVNYASFVTLLTEAGSGVDVQTGSSLALGDTTETGSAADSVSGYALFVAAISEAGNAADLYAYQGGVFISQIDGTVLNELPVNATRYYWFVSTTEAVSAADNLSGSLVTDQALTETGTSSDSASGVQFANGILTETATAADAEAVLTQFVAALTESGSATESDVSSLLAVADRTEAGSAADSVSGIASLVAALTEAGSIADAISVLLTAIGALTEAGSAADAVSNVTTFVGNATETGSAADSDLGSLLAVADRTESGIANDAITAAASLVASLSEAGSVADVIAGLQIAIGVLTEAGSASTTQVTTIDFTSALTEAGSATDVDTVSMLAAAARTETGTASDSSSGLGVYPVLITDATAANDASTQTYTSNGSMTESGSADTSQQTGSTYSDTRTETLTAGEANSSIATMYASRPEVVSASDYLTSFAYFTGDASDILSANDSVYNRVTFVVTVGEPGAAADYPFASGVYKLAGTSAVLATLYGKLVDTYFLELKWAKVDGTLAAVEAGLVNYSVELLDTSAASTSYNIAVTQYIDYINANAVSGEILMSAEVINPESSSYVQYIRAA